MEVRVREGGVVLKAEQEEVPIQRARDRKRWIQRDRDRRKMLKEKKK